MGKKRIDSCENIGSTPVKALGATDQHSLAQLFNEGPNNKLINFIRVEKYDCNLEIPKIFEYTGIGYLGGKSINDLMNAEADSTQLNTQMMPGLPKRPGSFLFNRCGTVPPEI